jgi:O-antigen/teichoic acid export membrane protein
MEDSRGQAARVTVEATSGLKLFSRWLKQGTWAVLDQGLFSVSNLVLNVLLARWLFPQDYGVFATAFAVFLLIGTLHTGLFQEPMLVFGPGRYKDRLSEYLGTLLHGHLGFGLLIGLVLALTSLVLTLSGSTTASEGLLALALAGPFMLLLWLMRQACYARLEPHLAALASALYIVLVLAGAYALFRLGWLSSAPAFGLMGLSSLVVGLCLIMRLGVKRPNLREDDLARDVVKDHWRFGRWSLALLALEWFPVGGLFLLLSLLGSLEASASLRALMNFILPAIMGMMALCSLLIPNLIRARGGERFGFLVRSATMLFVLGSVLYWLLLGLFHAPLIDWLYGGRYGEDAHLLWILGLIPIFTAVASVMNSALRALERPDRLFWPYAFATVSALALGPFMILAWGLAGAVLTYVVWAGIAVVIMTYLFVTFQGRRGERRGA